MNDQSETVEVSRQTLEVLEYLSMFARMNRVKRYTPQERVEASREALQVLGYGD